MRKIITGLIAAGLAAIVVNAAAPSTPQGIITVREFVDIEGTAIGDLTGNAKFPGSPDIVDYAPYFEWPQSGDISTPPPNDVKNNYGVQMLGYFYPPATGNYVFIIAADDAAELWLSTNDDPANRRRIAIEPVWNPVRAWDSIARRNEAAPENNSGTYAATQWPSGNTITLTANTPYYIEALMKEGIGGDNLAVAVQDPNGVIDSTFPIPGQYLSSIDRASLADPYVGEVIGSPAGFDFSVFDGTGPGARTVTSATARLNGAEIPVTVATVGGDKVVRYRIPLSAAGQPLNTMPSGNHTVDLTITHSGGGTISATKSFTLAPYATIPESFRLLAPATTPGMVATVHQISAPRFPGDLNSIANAEQHHAGGLIDPETGQPFPNLSTEKGNVNISVVNWQQDGADIGATPETGPDNFNSSRPEANPVPNDFIPGIPGEEGLNDHIVAEVVTYLQLNRGVYRMGVNSDDGFKVSVAPGASSPVGLVLGSFNTGRGAADTLFDFAVEADGFYPTRLLWWEGTGGADVEWFTEDLTTGERHLVNGTSPNAVKAFRTGQNRAFVDSVLPAPGYTGVARTPTFRIVLQDGATQVVNNSVALQIDGEAVTSNVSKTGATTTMTWSASQQFDFSSTHTATLTYQESGTPPITRTNNFAFTVIAPSLLDLPQPLFFIEAEDFNYDGGQTNPQQGVAGMDVNVMPYYGGAYDGLGAIEGIDYNNDDGNDSDQYRTELDAGGENEVNITGNLGSAAGNGLGGTIPVSGMDRGQFEMQANYRIGWVGGADWQNYTRTIPAGWYTAWAALSYDGTDAGQLSASLLRVTSDPTQEGQTVETLGQFSAPGSGGWGLSNLVPMTTAAGAPAAFRLPGGAVTLRFNLGSGDFDFFVLHPVAAPPPGVAEVPQDSVKRNEVVLAWRLNDSDTQVAVNTVRLFVNNQDVTSRATVTKTDTGATVAFDDTGTMYASGEVPWRLTFSDSANPPQSVTAEGTFVVNPYPTPGVFVIEAEDFNYSDDGITGGRTNPQQGVEGMDVNVMPYLGGAYDGLNAVKGVDYNNADGNDSDVYRTELDANGENEVNITAHNSNRYALDRGTFELESNYRIGWVGAGDWGNYTRNFPAGNYNVWAALSYDGRGAGQLRGSLDLITSNPAQAGQTTQRLGAFSAPGSAGWGRNELVPMKTEAGALATVTMGGVQTVRYNMDSGDFDYLLFVPAGDVQPPVGDRLNVSRSGDNITLTWEGQATLEQADAIEGPWTTVTTTGNSFTTTAAGAQRFYRLRF